LRLSRLLLCLLLIVSVAAGCRLPGRVRPSVKIGLVAPFEGRYRAIGYDVIYAVRLALQEANGAGGVAGYSVELVAYDDGGDPAQAAEQARKLDADPEVVAVIGHFLDETTQAALDRYAAAGLPLIAPGALDPALTAPSLTAYRMGPSAEALADELLQHLAATGQARLAVVTEGGSLGQALVDQAAAHALQPVIVISPATDGWLEQVLAAQPDAVACDAAPVAAGEAAAALRGAGWQGAIVGGPTLAASDFAAVAEDAASGASYVTPWPDPTTLPEAADFVAAYRELSRGLTPGPLALAAYEATWVLLEALERSLTTHGVPSRGNVAQALAGTERDGLLGRITFDTARTWREAPAATVALE